MKLYCLKHNKRLKMEKLKKECPKCGVLCNTKDYVNWVLGGRRGSMPISRRGVI